MFKCTGVSSSLQQTMHLPPSRRKTFLRVLLGGGRSALMSDSSEPAEDALVNDESEDTPDRAEAGGEGGSRGAGDMTCSSISATTTATPCYSGTTYRCDDEPAYKGRGATKAKRASESAQRQDGVGWVEARSRDLAVVSESTLPEICRHPDWLSQGACEDGPGSRRRRRAPYAVGHSSTMSAARYLVNGLPKAAASRSLKRSVSSRSPQDRV